MRLKEKEQLFTKNILKENGNIVSDGVLNLEVLLTRFHDYILTNNLDKSMLKEIENLYEINDSHFSVSGLLDTSRYFGKAYFKEGLDNHSYEVIEVYENVENYLDSLSPKGYYFGSQEGDGACIGYFSVEDNDY